MLSGTVFLPDGATPAGAGVQVTAKGALPDVVVETDTEGRFHFGKIFPEGGYTLTLADPVTGAVARDNVYLSLGQDVTHDLRLKGRGAVRVVVVDGADEPIPSALVKVRENDYPNRLYERVLDTLTGARWSSSRCSRVRSASKVPTHSAAAAASRRWCPGVAGRRSTSS